MGVLLFRSHGNKRIGAALIAATLIGAAPSFADESDPTDAHRWHMPNRGARDLSREILGPVHAEWNHLGHLMNEGKSKLGDWGLRFDVDLDFFNQHASHVAMGQHNFGTFSWRVMGDWELFDLENSEHFSAIGKGFLAWNTFGAAGLDYDASNQTLTDNVGSVNTLNATVFDKGAVVDELYWKQVALGGKLVVLAGKIDMLYHFDTNRVANDGYAEFYSYSLQNNPSIPGPLYGGFGGVVRANLSKNAYAMFGVGDSSMGSAVVPWDTVDNDSWYQLEIAKSITLTPNLQLIFEPANNAGDDVVVVPGIRLALKF